MLNFPIDFVFPYVDNNREQWREEYKQYCIQNNLKERLSNIDGERYRDLGLLKYLFRSIDKFAPWIHKVYLIVSNMDQVPEWINQDKVKVVLHKDIIPKEYLPTYNSTTIEMFIHNIKGLSEHLIYGNDDMYFTNYVSPEDFFTEDGLPKVDMLDMVLKSPTPQFYQVCYNCYRDLSLALNKSVNGNTYKRPEHSVCPILLRHCKEAYRKLESKILAVSSTFRTATNYNQYLYTDYAYLTNQCGVSTRKFKYIALKDNINQVYGLINGQQYQISCLNDTIATDKKMWSDNIDKIYEAFSNIGLQNKSKYEL